MKLTKNNLRAIIKEFYNSGASQYGASNIGGPMYMAPNAGADIRNFKDGKRPDNSKKPQYEARPPYETEGVESEIKDGELYITIGKTKYQLVFKDDKKTGMVYPVEPFQFRFDNNGNVEWYGETPDFVKHDPYLDKEIKAYSGRNLK